MLMRLITATALMLWAVGPSGARAQPAADEHLTSVLNFAATEMSKAPEIKVAEVRREPDPSPEQQKVLIQKDLDRERNRLRKSLKFDRAVQNFELQRTALARERQHVLNEMNKWAKRCGVIEAGTSFFAPGNKGCNPKKEFLAHTVKLKAVSELILENELEGANAAARSVGVDLKDPATRAQLRAATIALGHGDLLVPDHAGGYEAKAMWVKVRERTMPVQVHHAVLAEALAERK